jgi:hypothetical protein
VIFLAAALAGLAFGAADQYLGSFRSMLALGPWAVSVSQMSAPWLLLPFAFGCTQNRARRAMLLGLVATVAALVGYLAMTVSPVENVALRAVPSGAWAWIRTNLPVIVGGLVTGPVFGLLGQRWRVERWWPSRARRRRVRAGTPGEAGGRQAARTRLDLARGDGARPRPGRRVPDGRRRSRAVRRGRLASVAPGYSHSIVPGGLDVMS